MEVQLHAFLISVLDEDEWSASSPTSFNPEALAPDIHRIQGQVGPSVGLGVGMKGRILFKSEILQNFTTFKSSSNP
jgi:hypothetical protein